MKTLKFLNPVFLIGSVLCGFGLHRWQITKWAKYKDLKCKRLDEEGFYRTCERCDKKQELKRPEKYHPSKYVWTDVKNCEYS